MPSLVAIGFHPPPGRRKTLSFFLSVRHAFSVTLFLSRFLTVPAVVEHVLFLTVPAV